MSDFQNLYKPVQHISMLNDENRMTFYYNKIYKNSIINNKICCDLGSGTGILALFALLGGAKHVYIIENQLSMIDIIRYYLQIHEIDTSKYTIMQGWSTEVTLPEKVDILIHELIGEWGNGEQGLSYVSEFKSRNLKNGGIIIPDIIEVQLTLQHTNELYEPKDKTSMFSSDMVDMKLSQLISKLNEDKTNYNARSVSHKYELNLQCDSASYLSDTSDCNIEVIRYDLMNDTFSEINEKSCCLSFSPSNKRIVSLLSTLKYYCSDDIKTYGDSWSNNGNWAKQQILIHPYVLGENEKITGIITLKNNPRSRFSQMISITLNEKERSILNATFVTSTAFDIS